MPQKGFIPVGMLFYVDIFLDVGSDGSGCLVRVWGFPLAPSPDQAGKKENIENIFMMARIGKALSAVVNYFVL
jgi:hypothetical protein